MLSIIHILGGLVLLLPMAYCLTNAQIEMIELQKELVKKYGKEIDFYKFLKLKKSSSLTAQQIAKNLKKLSKKYHPDKNKKYRKLYERLNMVTKIMTNDSNRKDYDYYLKNGFPKYDAAKGSYLFKRVQPQTWIILSFILVAASFIHYVILNIQYTANVKRIENFIKSCRGSDDTNGLGERNIMFKQHEDDPGKELLIKFGEVFLKEKNGDYTLISTDTLKLPSIYDSLIFSLPRGIWRLTVGRFFAKSQTTKSGGTKLGKKASKAESKKEPKIYEITEEDDLKKTN